MILYPFDELEPIQGDIFHSVNPTFLKLT